ncbi:hypothetical protein BC831DRAFT_441295 [Entophlyctis helioformis]|nr:hypothetical protein BC831DRAFT_441295 [Entophlyctis helioformis]
MPALTAALLFVGALLSASMPSAAMQPAVDADAVSGHPHSHSSSLYRRTVPYQLLDDEGTLWFQTSTSPLCTEEPFAVSDLSEYDIIARATLSGHLPSKRHCIPVTGSASPGASGRPNGTRMYVAYELSDDGMLLDELTCPEATCTDGCRHGRTFYALDQTPSSYCGHRFRLLPVRKGSEQRDIQAYGRPWGLWYLAGSSYSYQLIFDRNANCQGVPVMTHLLYYFEQCRRFTARQYVYTTFEPKLFTIPAPPALAGSSGSPGSPGSSGSSVAPAQQERAVDRVSGFSVRQQLCWARSCSSKVCRDVPFSHAVLAMHEQTGRCVPTTLMHADTPSSQDTAEQAGNSTGSVFHSGTYGLSPRSSFRRLVVAKPRLSRWAQLAQPFGGNQALLIGAIVGAVGLVVASIAVLCVVLSRGKRTSHLCGFGSKLKFRSPFGLRAKLMTVVHLLYVWVFPPSKPTRQRAREVV